jgi:hypothetical protein
MKSAVKHFIYGCSDLAGLKHFCYFRVSTPAPRFYFGTGVIVPDELLALSASFLQTPANLFC